MDLLLAFALICHVPSAGHPVRRQVTQRKCVKELYDCYAHYKKDFKDSEKALIKCLGRGTK